LYEVWDDLMLLEKFNYLTTKKMTIYELKLKPLSGWITDLTADTIFGHLCWQIKYKFWEDILEEFLKEMKESPIFIISDVIFQNNYPKPLLDENFVKLEKLNKDFYNRNKEFLKDEKILNKIFRKIINSKDLQKDILDIKNKLLSVLFNKSIIWLSNSVKGLGNLSAGKTSEIVKIGLSFISFKNSSKISSQNLYFICQHTCPKIVSAVRSVIQPDNGFNFSS